MVVLLKNSNCQVEADNFMSNQEAWFCLIRRVLEAAVEEHLHLCQHRVVAVAVQLRSLKTLLWMMDGGGGAVGTRQPDKSNHDKNFDTFNRL